jgi:phage terminase large subunit-like protein
MGMSVTSGRPRRRRSQAWVKADLEALKLSPEVAWYLEERGYKPPTCPPQVKTPEPRNVRGAHFDPDRVDHVIASFRRLRHVKGRFAGQPFEPATWEVAYYIAPVFGWVARSKDSGEYARIITTAYLDMPRKQGKTTIAGGTAIYLTGADGEPGAQVICAATTRDQARFAFDPVRAIVRGSPQLSKHFRAFTGKIIHKPSGSYFAPVAHAGDAQHGADLHGYVVDELHLHKTIGLIEALETGTGSRVQPLGLFITTADSGRRHTPYDVKRSYVDRLARGSIKDPTWYGVVWAAPAGANPFVEATWKIANPGYGVSPTKRYMATRAKQARNSPVDLASFQRLHLGIRTKQEFRYLDLEAWDRNASIVDLERLKGRKCWGGLDLGSTSDLTALVWVFPNDDATAFDVLLRAWAPEDSVGDLDDRTARAASLWVKQGWLSTTPGNVTDYAFIKKAIDVDRDAFLVQEIAYDRWNAQQIVNDLITAGAPMEQHGQGFASMTAPTKDLQRLVLTGTVENPVIRHGGNPLLRWTVDNFAVALDPAGNVKPDKLNCADKIDPVVALIMALGRAVTSTGAPFRSAYEDGRLDVV